MRSTFPAIKHLESIGLILSYDAVKGLKVTPKEKITTDGRAFINEHKGEIVSGLLRREELNQLPSGKESRRRSAGMNKAPGSSRNHSMPSPVALAWLLEHRQALDNAGWTRSELYDRRKYRQSIAFLGLWDEAFSRAFLHETGEIEFELSRHGRDRFQTARPQMTNPKLVNTEVNSETEM